MGTYATPPTVVLVVAILVVVLLDPGHEPLEDGDVAVDGDVELAEFSSVRFVLLEVAHVAQKLRLPTREMLLRSLVLVLHVDPHRLFLRLQSTRRPWHDRRTANTSCRCLDKFGCLRKLERLRQGGTSRVSAVFLRVLNANAPTVLGKCLLALLLSRAQLVDARDFISLGGGASLSCRRRRERASSALEGTHDFTLLVRRQRCVYP